MGGDPAPLVDPARLYGELFQHAAELVIVTRPDGMVVDVNPAVEAVTGYHRDEIRNRPYAVFLDDSALEEATAAFESLLSGHVPGGIVATVARAKDGRRLPLLASAWPIVEGDGIAGVLTIAREQERLPADAAAHELNNLLAVVAGHAELALRTADDRTRARLEEILGAARRGAQLARRLIGDPRDA